MKSDDMMTRLRDHYKYEVWRGRNTLSENLFIYRFFLSGNEFSTWSAHKIKPIIMKGWPPSIKSIWRREEGDTEALLRVNVFECVSRDAAHSFLLQFLSEFQSLLETAPENVTIGDVAFTVPMGISIVAARANLVFHIARVDPNPKPVYESAREFDMHLITREKKKDVRVVPEFISFETKLKEPRVHVSLPLKVEAFDPLNRPLWYKFFSAFGEMCLENNQVVYRSTKSGPQGITVFAINADGGMAQRTIELHVT